MKKLSTWLIIIGIIVACIPLGGRLYMHYQQDKMYNDYLSEIENAEILDEAFAEEMTTEEAIAAQNVKESSLKNVLGRINIPAISSDQILLEGSTNKELRYGAGHITGSAMPGQTGNCAIAAHRNYTFGTYFSRLDELAAGDSVKITYNGNTYTYSVTESLVVVPSDVSVLKATANPTLTLITCHPKGSNTHRLIVKGVLLDADGNPIEAPNLPDLSQESQNVTPDAVSPPAASSEKPVQETLPEPEGSPAPEQSGQSDLE